MDLIFTLFIILISPIIAALVFLAAGVLLTLLVGLYVLVTAPLKGGLHD